MLELLTTQEMSEADRLTIEAGVSGAELMENAGCCVAEEVVRIYPAARRICVLCGPGNNGGDGFVAARHLAGRGLDVDLALMGPRDRLTGDAAQMASQWDGQVYALDAAPLDDADIVIDALFGAGLTRDVTGLPAEVIRKVNRGKSRVVAVDVPSGIDGTTGQVRGVAVRADASVTFFRMKTGHALMPGRVYCGQIVVRDIGIKAELLHKTLVPGNRRNAPQFWARAFPRRKPAAHKYDRGYSVVVSGGASSTGAARLAARGALRVGSGLVTVASPMNALLINAAHLTAIMVQGFSNADELAGMLEDRRRNAVLIGPGAGVGEKTANNVKAVLRSGASVVLDADALSSFGNNPQELFDEIKASPRHVVLTPHEGEFRGLFTGLEKLEFKPQRVASAAVRSGATIILKGHDTVISGPETVNVINDNAPATLATAGSGDVLAGFVTGLLAQGMPALEAACAAVWLHGEAASQFGPGLISEDLAELLPPVLKRLEQELAERRA